MLEERDVAVSSPTLRILYHHRIAASDGMRVHVSAIVEALRARGHVVQVVGPAGGAEEAVAGRGSRFERTIEQVRKLLPRAAYELLELLYNIPAYLRLQSASKAFRPDVIYERYNLFLLAGLWVAGGRAVPLLLEVNSPLASERALFGGLQLKEVGRRCERLLWSRAAVVLPVSHVLAQQVSAVRRTRAGLQVLPNGVNLDHPPAPGAAARLRSRLNIPDGSLVLGFVGFVRSWHGVDWAVEALTGLGPDVHLVIVGDGPALEDLLVHAKEHGVESRVHLIGRVAHQATADVMAGFDVALQIAATAYASPLKLIEYMGLGRAILATDQPKISELLVDGCNAVFFVTDSKDRFRAALQRLCADEVLRSRLGEEALRTVRERPLTLSHNAASIEASARRSIRLMALRGRLADKRHAGKDRRGGRVAAPAGS